MKVKKLWIGAYVRENFERAIIVKECPFIRKVARVILNEKNEEFRDVFTNKIYWFTPSQIIPLSSVLPFDDLKPNICRNKLMEFYKKNEEDLRKKVLVKAKIPIGFKG